MCRGNAALWVGYRRAEKRAGRLCEARRNVAQRIAVGLTVWRECLYLETRVGDHEAELRVAARGLRAAWRRWWGRLWEMAIELHGPACINPGSAWRRSRRARRALPCWWWWERLCGWRG